jgi:hypothetical protein
VDAVRSEYSDRQGSVPSGLNPLRTWPMPLSTVARSCRKHAEASDDRHLFLLGLLRGLSPTSGGGAENNRLAEEVM